MTTKERNYGLKKKCDELQHENKVLRKAVEMLIIDLGAYGDGYSLEQSVEDTIEQAEKEVEDETID